MFCKRCGMQIDDTASFCEHCGADQRPAANPQPEATGYQPSQPQQAWQPEMNPMPGASATKSTPYLVWSILVTIFCCLPLGIPAIVFAAKIDNCNAQGDFAGAAENARKSKNFMIWGAVLSVVFTIIYFVFFGLMLAETNFHF
ncbi:MAG: CD225/dispanin family protein [Oscillospiraceae bacterium]|nr:CD225/dispanin family protein [Oscillospiraceae bacterium]